MSKPRRRIRATPRHADIDGRVAPRFPSLIHPELHAALDWSRPVDFLDKELQSITRRGRKGRRAVDLLESVQRLDGVEQWLPVHVEIQGRVQEQFTWRMFNYHARLVDRYERPVDSLALLTDWQASWRLASYEHDNWGCAVNFRYPVVKVTGTRLRVGHGREDELARMANPFAEGDHRATPHQSREQKCALIASGRVRDQAGKGQKMTKVWLNAQRTYRWIALACLAGAILAWPGVVGADVIPQGQKVVSYCFAVTNVGDFPDYVVLAYEQPPNPGVPATVHVIADASCFAARFSATFYAMKRAEFSPGLIPTERSAQRAFLESDPRVIRSQGGTKVAPVVYVDQGDSRTSIAETYRVASLTDSAITVERVQAAPSAFAATTNRALNLTWFALLPLAALIAIGVVLLVRRGRRG